MLRSQLVIPAGLGSSNVHESSIRSSGLDDISLEAAILRQLQLVMEQVLTHRLMLGLMTYKECATLNSFFISSEKLFHLQR